MYLNNRQLGYDKESLVVKYLHELGYKVLERNWHNSNRGELDIIATDPKRFNEEYLIFIEVKYRQGLIENSLNALPKSKQLQLRKLALHYCQKKKINPQNTNISFDFIALNDEELEHLKNIF